MQNKSLSYIIDIYSIIKSVLYINHFTIFFR